MKHRHDNNPILITGAHRSGTTFVGKILALPTNIDLIYEPFNKNRGIEGIDKWFLYIKRDIKNEAKYRNLIEDILHGRAVYKRSPVNANNRSPLRKLGRLILRSTSNLKYQWANYNPLVKRYLIKDATACMSSEYLHLEFNMDVVILIRHPAAFVGSLKRLNWRFNFNELFSQPELMNNHLERILKDLNLTNSTIVGEGAVLWNCIYSVLCCYLDRNPQMIAIRHEDLSVDPIKKFKLLYEKLNIEFTPRIENKIKQFTGNVNPVDPDNNKVHSLRRNSKQNIKRWKRLLTSDEVDLIKEITEPVAKKYYKEEDWQD